MARVNMREKPAIYFDPDPADLAMEFTTSRGTKIKIYRTMCKNETPEEHEARRKECERIANRALYNQWLRKEKARMEAEAKEAGEATA